MQNVISYF